MRKTRVVLLEADNNFCRKVSAVLNVEPDMELEVRTESVEEALNVVAGGQADFVLVDADVGQDRGVDFLERARGSGFDGPALLLTSGVSKAEREGFERQGVSGFLPKDVSAGLLASRIREAMGAIPRRDVARAETASSGWTRPLTVREYKVLRLVIDGFSNKEIGARTGSSEAAVKGILQQLFRKTGARTRSQLVRLALQQYGNLLCQASDVTLPFSARPA